MGDRRPGGPMLIPLSFLPFVTLEPDFFDRLVEEEGLPLLCFLLPEDEELFSFLSEPFFCVRREGDLQCLRSPMESPLL